MTFDELPLYEAIYNVYQMIENPRSDTWLRSPKAEELGRWIQRELPLAWHFDLEQSLRVWSSFGKSSCIDGDSKIKKVELAVMVARVHGHRCFYKDRGRGECSNEVQVDRIVPGARGGKYTVENCMIACSLHSQQRQDWTIEEYLCQSPSLFMECAAVTQEQGR